MTTSTSGAQWCKEDWGGDGSSRLNLSERHTGLDNTFKPRTYQSFDSNSVPVEADWRIPGVPDGAVAGQRRLLTRHAESGALTARVTLPPGWQAPRGVFTADLEILVLSGVVQYGSWRLGPQGYGFIPAGVAAGPWRVLGDESAEVVWMENGPVPLEYRPSVGHLPGARLDEFIPALNSMLHPWRGTETSQFAGAVKKYLRKYRNGGGTWLLALLPHFDNRASEVQCYNEEGYCLAGTLNIGDAHFEKDHFAYVPSFAVSDRHVSVDGCNFLIRVDRDLSQHGTVLFYED